MVSEILVYFVLVGVGGKALFCDLVLIIVLEAVLKKKKVKEEVRIKDAVLFLFLYYSFPLELRKALFWVICCFCM